MAALEPSKAESPAEREALRRSQRHESWYGSEILAVDAAAVGILLVGAAIVATGPPSLTAGPAPPPAAFMAASLGVYAVGSPIVHVAHGNFLPACGSIGLRAALPLAGFALAAAADGASKHASGAADSVFGVVVGSAGAMATDAGVLAWRRWYGADMWTALFRVQGSF